VKAQYVGHLTVAYSGYSDLSTGRTLTCIPGEIYDITPGVPQDGRFTAVTDEEELPVVYPGMMTWLGLTRGQEEEEPGHLDGELVTTPQPAQTEVLPEGID